MKRIVVRSEEILRVLGMGVAKRVRVGPLPSVPLHRQRVAAELPHHLHVVAEPLVAGLELRVRVAVPVRDVADGPEVPAARHVDQPRGIGALDHLADLGRPMLAPRLVEGNPHDDGRVVLQRADHLGELREVLLVSLFRPLRLALRRKVFGTLNGARPVAGAHRPRLGAARQFSSLAARGRRLVLPHHHAHAVAVGVEAPRLHFHVLADDVEAAGLHEVYVESHRSVRWRSQSTIGPPSLVQDAVVEDELVVQGEPVISAGVTPLPHRSDASIRLHRVHLGAVSHKLHR
mmetsp:Transcript_112505/g.318986  ORF Transcript_112505/g.318986 Transcript_112505/m.318986 type:complete len:289 (+) Transcript_112505:471-1337(+)